MEVLKMRFVPDSLVSSSSNSPGKISMEVQRGFIKTLENKISFRKNSLISTAGFDPLSSILKFKAGDSTVYPFALFRWKLKKSFILVTMRAARFSSISFGDLTAGWMKVFQGNTEIPSSMFQHRRKKLAGIKFWNSLAPRPGWNNIHRQWKVTSPQFVVSFHWNWLMARFWVDWNPLFTWNSIRKAILVISLQSFKVDLLL